MSNYSQYLAYAAQPVEETTDRCDYCQEPAVVEYGAGDNVHRACINADHDNRAWKAWSKQRKQRVMQGQR